MSEEKPTGLTRLQVVRRFLRRPIVILQIQVEQDWRERRGSGYHSLHVGTHYYWRDATPEEFKTFQDRDEHIKHLARHAYP